MFCAKVSNRRECGNPGDNQGVMTCLRISVGNHDAPRNRSFMVFMHKYERIMERRDGHVDGATPLPSCSIY